MELKDIENILLEQKEEFSIKFKENYSVNFITVL